MGLARKLHAMGFFDLFRKAKAPALDSSIAQPGARMGTRDVDTRNASWGSRENSPELNGTRRYTTYANMIANSITVALGVRYVLDILGGTGWKFQASPNDKDGYYKEFMESVLRGTKTPWGRHLKKIGMYKFNGASLHEWVAMRREDGMIGLFDLEHRPMATICQWDYTDDGIMGVFQRSRTGGSNLYIPREKLVYVVDDCITDNPEGVGLLRHVSNTSRQLERLEQLEGYGYEMDVNGVPKIRLPYGLLEKKKAGASDAEIKAIDSLIDTYEKWAASHVKNPALGIVMDSATYQSNDAASSPSGVPLFDLEMLSSTNSSAGPLNTSIERKHREIARILGIESLLLGTGGSAQASVSKDKTSQLQSTIMRMNKDIGHVVDSDVIDRVWRLNGFPLEMKPTSKPDPVNLRDVEAIVSALTQLAGAPFRDGDTAENEVRDMIGISHAPVADVGLKPLPDNEDDGIPIDLEG